MKVFKGVEVERVTHVGVNPLGSAPHLCPRRNMTLKLEHSHCYAVNVSWETQSHAVTASQYVK